VVANDAVASVSPKTVSVTFPSDALRVNFTVNVKPKYAGQTNLNSTTEEKTVRLVLFLYLKNKMQKKIMRRFASWPIISLWHTVLKKKFELVDYHSNRRKQALITMATIYTFFASVTTMPLFG
jgi:hypothetical protein